MIDVECEETKQNKILIKSWIKNGWNMGENEKDGIWKSKK